MFRQAVRQMLNAELLVCPRCGETNIPKAAPTIEVQQDGRLFCNVCAHCWAPAKEDLT